MMTTAQACIWQIWYCLGYGEIGHPESARILLREASAHRWLWNNADVLHGASGFGLAALRFWHKHNDGTALDNAVRVGDWLTRNAIRGPDGVRWASEDGIINLGHAQGGAVRDSEGVAVGVTAHVYDFGDERASARADSDID
jgi:hypothetical protein